MFIPGLYDEPHRCARCLWRPVWPAKSNPTPGSLVKDSAFMNNQNGLGTGTGAGTGADPFGSIAIERALLEQNTNFVLAASGAKTTVRKSR
jgi:hypothetical protein